MPITHLVDFEQTGRVKAIGRGRFAGEGRKFHIPFLER